jgi:hypothetical protein
MNLEAFEKLLRENSKRVARWFRNRNFWAHVRVALRDREKGMSVRIELTADTAQRLMADVVHERRSASAELVEAWTKAQQLRVEDRKLQLARRRRAGRKKKGGGKPKELAHPRFKAREKELLAILRKDREVDVGC